MAIRQDLFLKIGLLTTAGLNVEYDQFESFTPFNLLSQIQNWDIANLYLENVADIDNSGILPDGTPTVTVAGHVYRDGDVNYWLYGCIISALGVSAFRGFAYVDRWVNIAHFGDRKLNKELWYLAGYLGNPSLPASTAIPNVDPDDPLSTRYFSSTRLGWYAGYIRGAD